MKIFKYGISLDEIEDDLVFSVPCPIRVLSAINQGENMCIYILVDETGILENVKFRVLGTGHPVDGSQIGEFIDTVSFMNGQFVVHVFRKR